MADENTAPLSGAPDNTAEGTAPVQNAMQENLPADAPIVWDANNRLVDPELDAHFKQEADRVLGRGQYAETDNSQLNLAVPPETQQAVQMLESQTADPLTSPQPVNDPNTRPSLLANYPETQEAIDRAKVEPALSGDNTPTVGGHAEMQVPQNPIREDELGNVRGNPAGAEGGAAPEAVQAAAEVPAAETATAPPADSPSVVEERRLPRSKR